MIDPNLLSVKTKAGIFRVGEIVKTKLNFLWTIAGFQAKAGYIWFYVKSTHGIGRTESFPYYKASPPYGIGLAQFFKISQPKKLPEPKKSGLFFDRKKGFERVEDV